MAYAHLESLVDLRQKEGFAHRHRRTIALGTVLVVSAILGIMLISGVAHGAPLLSIEPPMSKAIALRPDYRVSTYLEARGSFSWFIGVASTVAAIGIAFAGLGPACVVTTGGLLIAGCVLAAVGAAMAIVGAIQAGTTQRMLSIAQQERVYLGYIDQSKKWTIDPPKYDLSFDHDEFLHRTFGSEYTFAGMITKESSHNRHLVERNNGSDVPVFSFTTKHGIRLHHIFIHNEEEGTRFHRFGFHSVTQVGKGKRQTSEADAEEYFTSGGIDALDCAADDTNSLSIDDQDQMQSELDCALPDFNSTTEFSLQIYDQTTMETIAAGQCAPVDANGTSVITQSTYTECPDALTTGDNCGDQTASDRKRWWH